MTGTGEIKISVSCKWCTSKHTFEIPIRGIRKCLTWN